MLNPVESAVTGAQAGLDRDAQIRIALEAMVAHSGLATTQQLYDALQARMADQALSVQGQATLRTYVNREAVAAGFVYKHDKDNTGWRITPEGRDFLGQAVDLDFEQVVNVDTQAVENKPSNAVRGAAFERYVLQMLKQMYSYYTWYHQGQHKASERGLDFIGTRVSDQTSDPQVIGVQVKFHAPDSAPAQVEWLKFLAGCFARRVNKAVFITTGRLTSEQRREANEAKVLVIEGRDEVHRIASKYGIAKFDMFDDMDANVVDAAVIG
jgi:hypothetical protein